MFACIFIPDFSVEAVLRTEPILRGHPVAVLEGTPPLCYVVGVNDPARHIGVQVGMTKMQVEPNGKTANPLNGKSESVPAERGSRDELRTTKKFKDGGSAEGQRPAQMTIAERVQHRGEEVHYWHGSMYRSSAGEPLVEKPKDPRATRVTGGLTALTLRQRSAAQEAAAHAALLDAAHAISPRVEDTAMDTVVLEVSGLERLFGTTQQIGQELSRRLLDVGLQGNVAVARNPDAAEHAARGFAGITIVPAGREPERLGVLPLEVLFQAELAASFRREKRRDRQRKTAAHLTRMQETLDRWGIRTFRALAALPPVSLSERLGTDGVRLQTLASGAAVRDLILSEPVLRFEETIELEYPVGVLESLGFLLASMLEGLCGRLSARALSTNELRLRMKLEYRTADETTKSEEELEGEPIAERKITLPVPMNDAKLFLKLLQLELSASPPGAPITQLWLTAEPARPQMGQAGLFLPLAPEAQKLELTLARIHKLLGVRDALRAGSAELLDTHEPDAFRVIRFQPRVEEEQNCKTKPHNKDIAPMCADDAGRQTGSVMAMRRCRPPFAASVEMRNGLPVRLMCAELGTSHAQHDNIVWAAGPWLSSGNWWELPRPETEKRENETDAVMCRGTEDVKKLEHAWAREEWDVALAVTVRGSEKRERETEIGLYRLVLDRTNGRWLVEGSYD